MGYTDHGTALNTDNCFVVCYRSLMARSPSLCGIILAAGASSRMGRDKALLPWPVGHRGRTAQYLARRMDRVVAATHRHGHCGGRSEQPRSGAHRVLNRRVSWWRTGLRSLASSVRSELGLKEVLGRGRDSAMSRWLIARPSGPQRMNILHSAFLGALEQNFWAVMPEYDERHGHPILLAREMIERLLRAQLTAHGTRYPSRQCSTHQLCSGGRPAGRDGYQHAGRLRPPRRGEHLTASAHRPPLTLERRCSLPAP